MYKQTRFGALEKVHFTEEGGGVFIKVDGLAAYTSIGIIILQCVTAL